MSNEKRVQALAYTMDIDGYIVSDLFLKVVYELINIPPYPRIAPSAF